VTCSGGGCADAADFADNTLCSATFQDKMCLNGQCTESLCAAFGLEEAFSTDAALACVVTCDVSGTVTKVQDVAGAFTTNPLNRTTGTPIDLPTGNVARSPGARCNFIGDNNDVKEGVCDSSGVCKNAEGGRFKFDELEEFLRGISVDNALSWAQSTDFLIPNYAWLLVGVALLACVVVALCRISDANDAKRRNISA
jgi:hypothetical protein